MKTLDQIAAELQGYDPQALRADIVNAFLERMVDPVSGTEDLGLFEALGRVLAHDVVSPFNVPPHDNSAMDGYAFDGSQLGGAAITLRVAGTAFAGAAWQGTVGRGQCLRIMTGAIMPAGLDTVVPQELVQVAGDAVTIPPGLLGIGDNRRLAGEDIRANSVALQKGEQLTPAALGLVASLGKKTVCVVRQLRVAYFSTGDEVLSLGEPPREGALLAAAFAEAASKADAIITSGGVSVGEADHTRAMMHKLGADSGGVAFWRIAMRPGRPMAVGRIGKSVLFGLPGNPVAVMVTFLAFVRPALLRMMGSTQPAPPLLKAHSSEALRKKPGRTEYQRGVVSRAADGRLQVRTTGNQGSGVLSSMVQANGLIVLHHDQGSVAVEDPVDVLMFDGAI